MLFCKENDWNGPKPQIVLNSEDLLRRKRMRLDGMMETFKKGAD